MCVCIRIYMLHKRSAAHPFLRTDRKVRTHASHEIVSEKRSRAWRWLHAFSLREIFLRCVRVQLFNVRPCTVHTYTGPAQAAHAHTHYTIVCCAARLRIENNNGQTDRERRAWRCGVCAQCAHVLGNNYMKNTSVCSQRGLAGAWR